LEEERIKSAFEIAMERISSLPELTPEEIVEQKEKEFKPAGLAISHKYFQGRISEDDLPSELSRHQGEKGEIVRRAFVSCLCQAIQLEDAAKADKALGGLVALAEGEKGDFRKTVQGNYLQARSDFERDAQMEFKKYDSLIRKDLENAGIRGSAVRPNLAENEKWLHVLSRIRQEYEPRLEKIKNELMARLHR
jgi:hypothetical protein